MDVIRTRSFARAGFLGNPSDGYFGKTISFTFTDFFVDLRLAESARLRFVPGEVDDASFSSPAELVRDLRLYGYYGGIRMLKAVAKKFFEYCQEHSISLPDRNFTAEYKINIPRLVGLSGSSAICSAMLKALMAFYEVKIPLEICPTICLEAERDELGIACGLQDRVIQMYNGIVYMDFEKSLIESRGYGRYERLYPGGTLKNPESLGFYVAYDPSRAEESGKAHKKVKTLFERNNGDIVAAMSEFADIAERGRTALLAGDIDTLNKLVNANFDLRDKIFNVADENRRMVMSARSVGASAKFAGSGGAIVGLCEDGAMFKMLKEKLESIGCAVLRPKIACEADEKASLVSSGWRNS